MEEEGEEEEEEVNDDNPNAPPCQVTWFNTTLASQLNPRNNNIEDDFNNIEQSCSRIKLGAPCSFPKSDGASFNKDNWLHIRHLHHIHKVTKVTMRLTLLACQCHQAAYNELEDIMTALLFTMRLVLDVTCQWYKQMQKLFILRGLINTATTYFKHLFHESIEAAQFREAVQALMRDVAQQRGLITFA